MTKCEHPHCKGYPETERTAGFRCGMYWIHICRGCLIEMLTDIAIKESADAASVARAKKPPSFIT